MELVGIMDWFKTLNKAYRPVTVEVNGAHYAVKTDGTLGEPVRPVIPIAPVVTPTLDVMTVTGFVDAFIGKVDAFPERVAVHVTGPTTVSLIALDADEWGRRHVYLQATCADKNIFPFDRYVTSEAFILALQSGFLPTENVIQLQRLASALTSEGSSVGVSDDGLSQVITIKTGTVTRGTVDLPPRIPLFAYRTFREVDPVESEFLVRLDGKSGEEPKIGLIQVDADKWKVDTIWAVKNWLTKNLPEETIIIA